LSALSYLLTLPLLHSFFSSLLLPPPSSTLFPYTTLFRSLPSRGARRLTCSSSMTSEQRGSRPRRCRNAAYGRSSTVVGVTLTSSDRKSTRLNSSHVSISYAVFCLKKKTKKNERKRCKGEG